MRDKCDAIKEMMKRENDQKIKDYQIKTGKKPPTGLIRSQS